MTILACDVCGKQDSKKDAVMIGAPERKPMPKGWSRVRVDYAEYITCIGLEDNFPSWYIDDKLLCDDCTEKMRNLLATGKAK